jgi:hypothetical protein
MAHSTTQIPRTRYVASVRAPFHTVYNAGSKHQFGSNPDVDIATVPEDVWPLGGAYPWPTAGATTTLVCADANDDAGGTGMRQVEVIGLVEDTLGAWVYTEEHVNTDGLTPVTLAGNFVRVFEVRAHTSGSGETNAGDIDVKHGATVLCRMVAGEGASGCTLYATPSDTQAEILKWRVKIEAKDARIVAVLQARHNHHEGTTGAWFTIDRSEIGRGDEGGHAFEIPIMLPAQTDIRIRVLSCDVNDTRVTADMDVFIYNPI